MILFAVSVVVGGVLAWRGLGPQQEMSLAGDADGKQGETRASEHVPKSVLDSPLAGRWYPAGGNELAAAIKRYVDKADNKKSGRVMALIMPHAGYRWSGSTAAYAVRQIAGRKFRTVVVMGPTHHLPMDNIASVPAYTHYRTPMGEVELETAFIRRLKQYKLFTTIPRAHDGEHSVQIEVPMLQYALGEFKLVPIVVGRLRPETAEHMARILLGMIDAQTLVVASSDFTHYGPRFGYTPFTDNRERNLEALAMKAFACIQRRDAAGFYAHLEKTGDTICGRYAIAVLLNMLPRDCEARLLHYDTSGRIAGDFSESVSYVAAAFYGDWQKMPRVKPEPAGQGLSRETRSRLLKLARNTIKYVFAHQAAPLPEQVGFTPSAQENRTMGAFVTLKKHGRLRGCIGEITPFRALYKAIMAQAVNAAFRDTRFNQLRAEELPEIRIEISALTPSHPVDSYNDIKLGRHGIVIEKHGRRAVFLPQVAPEQGWNLAQTLTHLSRKAGLPADAWKQGARFTVFEAIVFGEDE